MPLDTSRKVYRLAFSVLGERGAADDAAQDAMLRVWRNLERFRGESALSTWIYTIARNAALTARKAIRSESSIDDWGGDGSGEGS